MSQNGFVGTDAQPVITGYSVGSLDPLNPPGLCETNLKQCRARCGKRPLRAHSKARGKSASVDSCLIVKTEPTVFELFNSGFRPRSPPGRYKRFAKPDSICGLRAMIRCFHNPLGRRIQIKARWIIGSKPTPPEIRLSARSFRSFSRRQPRPASPTPLERWSEPNWLWIFPQMK